MNVGLLVLRAVLGAFVAAHGIQKLSRFWGGEGIAVSAAEFRADGFRGGLLTALMAGGTQIVAGFALIAGLLTPAAAAGVLGVMTVATTVKLKVGFWSQDGGFEYPLLLAILAVVVAWTGPGDYSLDHLIGFTGSWSYWVSGAATVAGVGAALLLRLVLHRGGNDVEPIPELHRPSGPSTQAPEPFLTAHSVGGEA
jgi:putative oxidoreductase